MFRKRPRHRGRVAPRRGLGLKWARGARGVHAPMLGGLLATVLAVVSACGVFSSSSDSGDGGPAKLRFSLWSNAEPHLKMLEGFAAEFGKSHPNVSVEFVSIPGSDYLTKVTTSLAGGRPFDAGWLGEGDVKAMSAAGALVDLGPVIKKTEGYDPSDFTDKAMRSWRQGEIHGVPFSTSPFFTYFNKDLFAAAGVATPDELAQAGEWTWDKLAEVAKKTTEASGKGVYGFQGQDGAVYENPVSFWNTAMPAILAYGGGIWDLDTGNCQLAGPQSVQAVKLLHRMAMQDKGMVPPGEQSDFFAGQAAMTINQLSRVSMLEEAPFEWGIAPLPSGPAGAPSFYGQAGVVAFSASKNADVAAEFVTFVTNKQNVLTMAEFFPPARRSVLESKDFLSANPSLTPKQMEFVATGVLEGESFPLPARFQEVNLSVKPELDKLWKTGADVRAVLDGVCKAAEPLLKEK